MTMREQKNWLIVVFVILMITCMLIIKKHHEKNELQERIYNHSEILMPPG